MRALSFSLPSPPPPPPPPLRKNPNTNPNPNFANTIQTVILKTAAGALCFSLLASPPFPYAPALASENRAVSPPMELCAEVAKEEEGTTEPDMTNEALVEEAWEVVNESFLPDAGTRPWSPEIWLQKKEDIHQSRIQTRSRAHDIIRKMLASLGDPYTRFLSPAEFPCLF